ncbi:hypothetical protein [Methylobacterium frigidaeris]|uniref:Uncharacterized protein n=1 Tax=Methylobacterium frigidaeris TaxID=2038277 RepID=A0AA37HIL5_9HYPH|nr:hypothetical protein [Methylobacterium frigidaeris]PIK73908.1 hypothetical protein CS379_05605 [Methylobacterium frigidaeris]GJD66558.1 hypothetical protein MPEAHAMD_6756 [Methylobacterium frigidaeris]
MPTTKRQLAGALLTGGHITERDRLAAFIHDEATVFAANPFPSTTAGAAHQRWGLREIEFRAMEVASAGLSCLLSALARLPNGEPLRQEILRAGSHSLYLFHHGDGCRIVGAVLHGKPRQELPQFRPSPKPRGRPRRSPNTQQLDLFGMQP